MVPNTQLAAFLRPTLWVLLAVGAGVAAWKLGWGSPGDNSAGSIEELIARRGGEIVEPDPALTPAEVVQIQLAGLADARGDGLGVLQCYAFASPRNRAATGPLDRFAEMVRTAPFASLARPRAVLVGEPLIEGRFAKLLVSAIDRDDQLHAFTFIMFRQEEAPLTDCWMTEAVYPAGGTAPPASEGVAPDAA